MHAKVLQSYLTLCHPVDCDPTRLLCPWGSLAKNTGVSYHALLQGIFLTQGSNPCLLCLVHWQADSLPLALQIPPIFFFWRLGYIPVLPFALPFKSGPLQDEQFLDKAFFFFKSLVCRSAVKDIAWEACRIIALHMQLCEHSRMSMFIGRGEKWGWSLAKAIRTLDLQNSPYTWNINSHSCPQFQIYLWTIWTTDDMK